MESMWCSSRVVDQIRDRFEQASNRQDRLQQQACLRESRGGQPCPHIFSSKHDGHAFMEWRNTCIGRAGDDVAANHVLSVRAASDPINRQMRRAFHLSIGKKYGCPLALSNSFFAIHKNHCQDEAALFVQQGAEGWFFLQGFARALIMREPMEASFAQDGISPQRAHSRLRLSNHAQSPLLSWGNVDARLINVGNFTQSKIKLHLFCRQENVKRPHILTIIVAYTVKFFPINFKNLGNILIIKEILTSLL